VRRESSGLHGMKGALAAPVFPENFPEELGKCVPEVVVLDRGEVDGDDEYVVDDPISVDEGREPVVVWGSMEVLGFVKANRKEDP